MAVTSNIGPLPEHILYHDANELRLSFAPFNQIVDDIIESDSIEYGEPRWTFSSGNLALIDNNEPCGPCVDGRCRFENHNSPD